MLNDLAAGRIGSAEVLVARTDQAASGPADVRGAQDRIAGTWLVPR
jgi:hypothetical protein